MGWEVLKQEYLVEIERLKQSVQRVELMNRLHRRRAQHYHNLVNALIHYEEIPEELIRCYDCGWFDLASEAVELDSRVHCRFCAPEEVEFD